MRLPGHDGGTPQGKTRIEPPKMDAKEQAKHDEYWRFRM